MNRRIFLAIPLPADLISVIYDAQKAILKVDRNIIAVPVDQLCIKLHHLNSVPEKDYLLLIPKLKELVKSMRPFTVNIAFLETRYNRHDKSQVLLNLKMDDSFRQISMDIATVLDKHELFQPRRIFPELTIAHVLREDPTQVKHILSEIDKIEIEQVADLTVNKFVLIEELWSKKGIFLRVDAQLPLC